MKNSQLKLRFIQSIFILLFFFGQTLYSQEEDQAVEDKAAIAQEVANPLTTMIFVPIQYNYDANLGYMDEGSLSSFYIQPIIPFSLGDKWNLITRTIFSYYSMSDVIPGTTQSGLGDISQSLFLSPSTSTTSGVTWGVGPVLSYPTASHDAFKTGKLGVGPSAVLLQVKGAWTYGVLANHLWTLGSNEYPDVSATFFQPIIDYTSKRAVTYELTTEMSYDWISEEWSIPLIFTANKLVVLGKQMFMIGGGARYWADDTMTNPKGWGFNVSLYVLFPK